MAEEIVIFQFSRSAAPYQAGERAGFPISQAKAMQKKGQGKIVEFKEEEGTVEEKRKKAAKKRSAPPKRSTIPKQNKSA